ncbi:deoxyribose-phosphate aldolase [Leucobacter luti]|uniref:Deoxyribose-phosphate aldolase n=1 Tax=Leucobacter luti TaxID=340320 RepID=A0A4Q7U5E5_9MICO|nr:deoxyribose-phosphate aldolase [Leucobacter luti]MBL3700945.1 deoxyribose-phosphate aldolase [Leucobacter luti]RZT68834.1 deoxyribose-phosphate aldolase [Leucobacter luti]
MTAPTPSPAGRGTGADAESHAAAPAPAPAAATDRPAERAELTADVFLATADHTLLAPGTTPAELDEFLRAARALGVARVCISPTLIEEATQALRSSPVQIVTVVGFPSGVHTAEVKAAEAAAAVADGAAEIDMVLNRGLVRAGDWGSVEAEIRAVRAAVPGRVLKVILESAALSDAEIVGACRAAEAAGADFVKTSTGFDPAGGASVHAVALMAQTVGGRLGVKASGGIRTPAAVRELWAAGATRFGVSGTAAILAGWAAPAAPAAADPAGGAAADPAANPDAGSAY